MYILSYYTGHTATAALLKEGQIIACVSEERFSNIKNHTGFPAESIKWCLDYAKIKPQDLDLVVRCGLYGAPIHAPDKQNKTLSLLSTLYGGVGLIRRTWRRLVYYFPGLRPIGRMTYRAATGTIGRYIVEKEKKFVAQFLGVSADKIISFQHHLIHAAAAYYASPYNQEKAIVLTLDAEGDFYCSTVRLFEREQHRLLAATSRENSMGWLFLYVTQYLGMKPMEHEFKVMGLAPYAKPEHVNKLYEKIKDVLTLDPEDPLTFKTKFNTYDSLYYLRKNMAGQRFDNIAGAFQKLLEERMAEWTAEAIKKTGVDTVIFSGGSFMNVKANQKIAALPGLKKAFFLPSSGDESLPLGGCYLGHLHLLQNKKGAPIRPLADLYLGMSYGDDEVKKFLADGGYEKKYKVSFHEDIEAEIAKLLAKGKIVARMAGRMEWGARALGNRSILAHPQFPDAIRIINEQMKNRDFWMPFAPSILAERVKDYCVLHKDIASPYMALSHETTDLGKKELKAAMHPYDFTVRAQAVIKDWNPRYHHLIKCFEKETGIGGVLNTSFNLHGYPIVRGPKEALHAFENSGLEYLTLERHLIAKNGPGH
jgi:carbamoyltransferase